MTATEAFKTMAARARRSAAALRAEARKPCTSITALSQAATLADIEAEFAEQMAREVERS